MSAARSPGQWLKADRGRLRCFIFVESGGDNGLRVRRADGASFRSAICFVGSGPPQKGLPASPAAGRDRCCPPQSASQPRGCSTPAHSGLQEDPRAGPAHLRTGNGARSRPASYLDQHRGRVSDVRLVGIIAIRSPRCAGAAGRELTRTWDDESLRPRYLHQAIRERRVGD